MPELPLLILLLFQFLIQQLPFTGDLLVSDGESVYLYDGQNLYTSRTDTIAFKQLTLSLPTDFRIQYLDGDRFFIYIGDHTRIFRVRRSDLSIRSYKTGKGIIDLACDDEGRVMTIEDWGHNVLLDNDQILPGIDQIKTCGLSDGRFYLVDRSRIIFLNEVMVPDSIINLPKENFRAVVNGNMIYAYSDTTVCHYDHGWQDDHLPLTIKEMVILHGRLFILDVTSHLNLIVP